MSRRVPSSIWKLVHRGEHHLVIGYPLSRPAPLVDLTPAELQVIEAWLAGTSMAEIARHRGVAHRTVANQIASAYRKLGVGTRSELQARVSPKAN